MTKRAWMTWKTLRPLAWRPHFKKKIMSRIKITILAVVVLCCASQARADFRVYPTIQITNNPAQSNTLTIGTNVLTWLTNITNTASQVLITNTSGGNATNLLSQLNTFSISNVTVVSLTNGTYITLVGALNSNLTVTLVGTYARVTYYTSAVYAAQAVAMPFTKESLAQRQSIINGIMTGMNAYATSPLAVEMNMPTGTVAKAIVTGKLGILSTNTAGGTNGYIAFGQNTLSGGVSNWESYVGFRLQPMSYTNPVPTVTGPSGEYTNIVDGLGGWGWWMTNSPALLTVGSWWKYSPKLGSSSPANFGGVNPTNRIYASTIFENDGSDNFVQFNQPVTFSNAVNLAAGGSIAFGSGGTIAAGQITASVSLSGTNINGYAGNLTNKGTFSGGTIDGSAIQNGTLSNMTTIGGTLKATKSSGNFDVSSDIAYTVTNFTSLANGNNIAVDFGSNVFVRLAGSLTTDGSICGIVNGRGGKTHFLFNDQPYTVFLSQNTSDPVETNRFYHKWTSGDLSIPPYGWGTITYVMASQRWTVGGIYPQGAIATNAVALLNGVATNLAAWPSASNVLSLIVYSLTNSTTNMMEFQNNTGKVMTAFGPSGGLHIGGGSAAGASNLLVEGASTLTGGATIAGGLNSTGQTNQSLTASRLMATGASKEQASVTLTNGQLLIGNAGGYTAASITPGFGLSSTQRAGGLDLAAQRSFFGTHMARRRWWSYVPGSTTAYASLGAPTAPVTLETVSVISDANTGQAMTHTNAAAAFDSSMMRESAMYARTGRNLYFSIRVTLYNTNQNEIVNFGWCNSTSRVTTNNPTGINGAWVRASSTAPDTNFKLVCNNNTGTQTEVDTGIAIAGNPSSHLFEGQMNDSGGASNMVLYVDGTLVATATSDLPSTGINMLFFADFKTLDAVAKSNRVEHIYLESDR
jgi:hypothetical protein